MGPEQSKRCKIRVRRLGLFSLSSRITQNLTQNTSKGQHLQTKQIFQATERTLDL